MPTPYFCVTQILMAKKKLPPFKNEEYIDFSLPKERTRMEAAIQSVRAQLGKEYPLVIGEERIMTHDKIDSKNPANPMEIVGRFSKGTVEHASKALEVAEVAFESWKKVDSQKRADILLKAAKIMRRRRYEINAWMIFEVGKNWAEADGDTAEGIDFLEFYAREMYRLGGPQPVERTKGEKGYVEYIP